MFSVLNKFKSKVVNRLPKSYPAKVKIGQEFPTFASAVWYDQLPLTPPGQECSKGNWLSGAILACLFL